MSFTLKNLAKKFAIAVLLTLFSPLGNAAQPYQPQQALPILEKWRRRELEPLAGKNLFCGTEDLDSKLWFATDGGLLRYDGFETQFFPFPEAHKNTAIFQLFASKNGTAKLS